MSNENFISKIKLKNGEILTIKDPTAVTKNYVDTYFSNKFNFITVDELPNENPDPHVIYLLNRSTEKQKDSDRFDEYVWVNNRWELIGSLDLDDYVKKENLANLVANDTVLYEFFKNIYPLEKNIELKDRLLLETTDNKHYSISLNDLAKVITNKSYIKQDEKPVSASALKDFIKYRTINFSLENAINTSTKNVGDIIDSKEYNLTYVLNSGKPSIGDYYLNDGKYIQIKNDELASWGDRTSYKKIEIDHILGITVDTTGNQFNESYLISTNINKKEDNDGEVYILTSKAYLMKLDINGTKINFKAGEKLADITVTYI